jgi:alkylation response protein AidB-like acyl-CoA dehydrogenase
LPAVSELDDFVLRRADFSLSDEQEALRDAFQTFFDKECPTERVRGAEPTGWDDELWGRLHDLRPVAMGVPAALGGDDAGLVELAVVAEEFGAHAAPVPLVESTVAARLLASLDVPNARRALEQVLAGGVATVAIGPERSRPRLVPGGAAAPFVLGMLDDTLVLVERHEPVEHVENLACAPLGWVDIANGVELVAGPAARAAFDLAKDEWRILTAAALVGLGRSAEELAVQYAKDRVAFGVPIGTFQGVAHPLADVAIGVDTARRMALKAAWFADHEPAELGARASMAFVYAAGAAEQAGSVAIHTQGGFGFTLESDVQLYFRRAKGWALVLGDRRRELQRIAAEMLAARSRGAGANA